MLMIKDISEERMNWNIKYGELRKEYYLKELNESDINKDPFKQFSVWLQDAIDAKIKEPNAMAIATADKNGIPSVRTVLLKGITGGEFVFYTNYESRKAQDLNENPHAALLFFWRELERQVRISGAVEKIGEEESYEYFKTRPRGSRIGAWASKQSSVIPSRDYLANKYSEYEEKFGEKIPLPPFWGGYSLSPVKFEFWQGRENRLHDRIVYINERNKWEIARLSP